MFGLPSDILLRVDAVCPSVVRWEGCCGKGQGLDSGVLGRELADIGVEVPIGRV